MKQTVISINGASLACLIRKHPRSKRIRLTIYPDQRLLVTVPRWASFKAAEAFVQEKYEWISQKLIQHALHRPGMLAHQDRHQYLRYKLQAKQLVQARIEQFNQLYQFPVSRISIRNQRSRWGSCSARGTLSFNYKIIFLRPEQIDYLVVHELCHLKEMNHSPRFWALVARSIPQYRHLSRELRRL